MNKEEIQKKLVNKEITNRVCNLTGLPIYVEDDYYLMDGESYHKSVDIDSELCKLTKGQYKTMEELHEEDEETDFCYQTNDEDFSDVADDIIDNEFYYDNKGTKVEF